MAQGAFYSLDAPVPPLRHAYRFRFSRAQDVTVPTGLMACSNVRAALCKPALKPDRPSG